MNPGDLPTGLVTVSPTNLACASSVLREPSVPARESSIDLQQTVSRLRQALESIPYGTGLSAVQIGIPVQVAIVNMARRPDTELVIIDPELISISGRRTPRREGCLSLPHYKGEVVRRNKVSFKATDLTDADYEHTAIGYRAAVIQHELDHLQGVLYWDRMAPGLALSPMEIEDESGPDPT